jgi:NMD protein affecting ribosome stability and mRNA decay
MGKTKQCARCGVSYSGRTSKYCSDSCYVQSKAESRRRRVYGEDSLVTCEICEAKLSSPGGWYSMCRGTTRGVGFGGVCGAVRAVLGPEGGFLIR